jgi:hypothetical protein
MSLKEAEREAEKVYDAKKKQNEDGLAKEQDILQKYTDMLRQVEAYKAPTLDHEGYKDFMLQQLRDSIEHDCNSSYLQKEKVNLESNKTTGKEWKAMKIASVLDSIKYYEREWKKELQRSKDRTKWIKALKRSLKKYRPNK